MNFGSVWIIAPVKNNNKNLNVTCCISRITLGGGGRKTDDATYRLNWPRGRCSENNHKENRSMFDIVF